MREIKKTVYTVVVLPSDVPFEITKSFYSLRNAKRERRRIARRLRLTRLGEIPGPSGTKLSPEELERLRKLKVVKNQTTIIVPGEDTEESAQ